MENYKKIPILILIASLLAASAAGFAACGDEEASSSSSEASSSSSVSASDSEEDSTSEEEDESSETDGDGDEDTTEETVYYFDAECTDLTDLTGDAGSLTAYGRELITAGDLAHGGYYVDNYNTLGDQIVFEIESDVAATVSMSLLLSSNGDYDIDSDLLDIAVNGTSISYDTFTLTYETEYVSAIKSNIVFNEYAIGDIELQEGTNTVVFTEGEKATASGTSTYKVTFRFDAMVITSADAELTWDPIEESEWDDFYPEF